MIFYCHNKSPHITLHAQTCRSLIMLMQQIYLRLFSKIRQLWSKSSLIRKQIPQEVWQFNYSLELCYDFVRAQGLLSEDEYSEVSKVKVLSLGQLHTLQQTSRHRPKVLCEACLGHVQNTLHWPTLQQTHTVVLHIKVRNCAFKDQDKSLRE